MHSERVERCLNAQPPFVNRNNVKQQHCFTAWRRTWEGATILLVSRRAQNDVLLVQIGARLRELRTAAGLTQARLAELAELQPNSISLMESGGLAPTVTTLSNLARALGVRPMDMLDFHHRAAMLPDPTDAEERDVLHAFRAMEPANKVLVRGLMRALVRP